MDEINFLAVGDIYLKSKDNQDPFRHVYPIFYQKDLLFGNLETSLAEKGIKKDKAVVLSADPENVRYLKKADFDILNIANNHILDWGIDGFKQTIETLKENNLSYIGADYAKFPDTLFLEKKGIKFAFIGYTIGRLKTQKDIFINKLDAEKIIEDIDGIKDKCDFIVVSLHWGTENVFYPSPNQIKLAHKLIDNGVDLILGHHPHTIQGIEEYKNGLIAYSLGNFQFDPELSQSSSNKSMIFSIKFNKTQIVGYEMYPIEIEGDIPFLMGKHSKKDFVKFTCKISEPINKRTITKRWWFQQIGSEYLNSNMGSYMLRIKKYGVLHFFEFVLWLFTPFCIFCYIGVISKKLRRGN